MARRRLTPAAANVPRAEHFRDPASRARTGANAPIAHVAAEAASAAALEELAHEVEIARRTGRMVLDLALEEISADHLSRDRLPIEDEEMAALRESIRAHGQRSPIEVTPLSGSLPYGLISGWRRLMALKSLHAETGEARFSRIRALVCRPESAAKAYVAMVEENEIRVGLSHYERARVAALATRRGIFETEKQALLTLFATASRAKRSRIRAFLEIFHALDGVLRFPAALPERLGLQLVEMVRAGGAARITEAIARDDPQTPQAEQATLGALAAAARAAGAASAGTKAAEQLLPGVALESRRRGRTLTFTLRGPGVSPDLEARIRAALAGLGAQG